MCKNCSIIDALFKSASDKAHENYVPIINFLEALENEKRIELFAGDCMLKDAAEVLNEEKHYTVSHYFRCKDCGQTFFIGACVRGTPVYKTVDDIENENENVSTIIWGKLRQKYGDR